MRFRSNSALLLAAVPVLADCGTAAKDTASVDTPASSDARHREFSAETLDGTSFEGTQLAPQMPVPTHLIDPDGVVWRHFGVTEQSTYVVLDADGGVDVEGYLDDQVLADKVAELAG